MSIKTMEDLFVHELQDLLSAEKQILKALPKMSKAANSEALKSAFDDHLKQTQEQVSRLEEIFSQLGRSARAKKCEAMESIIQEGEEFLEEAEDTSVQDAGLIASAQHVEHYEIAGYGCARAHAELLGYAEAAELLQRTLDEESETDKKLTDLAMSEVNVEAQEVSEE